MRDGITEQEERAYLSGLKAGQIIALRELNEWAKDRRKYEQHRMSKLIHSKEEEITYNRADAKDTAYERVSEKIERLRESVSNTK